MKAMMMHKITPVDGPDDPLTPADIPIPSPGEREVLVRVEACGVCHTELDEIEGRTPPPTLPMVLGHQVVGRVVEVGPDAEKYQKGNLVGVGWIFSSCGKCRFCLAGEENLCSEFRATGRDVNGGYADYMVVPENSAFRIPSGFTPSSAAPLFCAGAIGYRSLRLTDLKDGQSLGLTGFGASAHLVLKMSRYQYPNSRVYVFARSEKEREFALELGAQWAGDTTDMAPERLQAIIDTTPAWKPVVWALKNLDAGGRLVVNAIRKEERDKDCLLELDYPAHLWMEKEIKSVANVARRDIGEFLDLAARIPIVPQYREYGLEEANIALRELKHGKIRGAKVLVMPR